jgi:hypothetical protein
MKRILLGFFLALSVYLFFSPPCEGALPGSALEFEKRYRVEGSTPEGAAKLFFDGICQEDESFNIIVLKFEHCSCQPLHFFRVIRGIRVIEQ